MKKKFLLMSVCFVAIVNVFVMGSNNWEQTGPTLEDILASKPTAIAIALKKGDLLGVQNFLKEGGDINMYDRYGMPLLVNAVLNHHMHILQYLVTHGADINKRCNAWRKNETGNTALMLALQCNDFPMVKYLVEHGADLNLTYVFGDTVFTWAQRFCQSQEMKQYFQDLAPTLDNAQDDN